MFFSFTDQIVIMSFTIIPDYSERSRSEQIDVLTKKIYPDSDPAAIIADIEADVKQEIGSYLNARYNMATCYPDTVLYSNTVANTAGQIVYDPTAKKYYTCIANAVAGTALTDLTKFTPGDSRIPMLKRIVIDLVFFQLYKSVNPRTVPEFRVEEREHTIKYLEKIANPRNNINADFLPLIVYDNPQRSNNFSWGSNPRRITNKY